MTENGEIKMNQESGKNLGENLDILTVEEDFLLSTFRHDGLQRTNFLITSQLSGFIDP